MTPAPNRRWFRWSLRTMFVVVTVACLAAAVAPWINSAHRQVQLREALLVRHRSNFRRTSTLPPATIPWVLKLVGGYPVGELGLDPRLNDADLEELQAAFPETYVHRFTRTELEHLFDK